MIEIIKNSLIVFCVVYTIAANLTILMLVVSGRRVGWEDISKANSAISLILLIGCLIYVQVHYWIVLGGL